MKPKIAVVMSGGCVVCVRSNIGAELEVEIVDSDNDEPDGVNSEIRCMELQTELPFLNY